MYGLAVLLALHLTSVPTGPNRQPQLAAAPGGAVLVFGSGNSIWLSRSKDNGVSFSAPTKVAEVEKLALGRHRGPRVAVVGETIVVSAVEVQKDLLAWRSTDGGRAWSKAAVINDQPTSAREGLHSMAADADGHIAAVWLDDRSAPGKRLFGAFSTDAGATWSKNVMLYESPSGTICECCHPSLVSLGHGEFAVMWRNKIDGSRDFYVLRIRDGKAVSAAAKQGDGTWRLDACPMDGGGIAVRNGQIITAWRREHDIYLAEDGKPEVRLGGGQDVALAANAKGAWTVWTEGKAVAALTPSAARSERVSEDGAFPSIVALPTGSVIAAWEENGSIAIRKLQ